MSFYSGGFFLGLQKRTLNDGRTFTIYKRYFDKFDIEGMFKKHHFELESFYIGAVFLAAIGKVSNENITLFPR